MSFSVHANHILEAIALDSLFLDFIKESLSSMSVSELQNSLFLVQFLPPIEKEKHPEVKLNVLIFIESVILSSSIEMLQNAKDGITSFIMKVIEENKDYDNKQQALRVLGTVVGCLGEEAMSK